MAPRSRPPAYAQVLGDNGIVYASFTHLNGQWMRGLFAKRDIASGEVLGVYQGVVISPKAVQTSTSLYLMTCRDPTDLRKRITIDGDPNTTPSNLVGFANYSKHKYANANFVDATTRTSGSNIVLTANQNIPRGTEVRVDYDMGSRATPFLDMELAKGVPEAAFEDTTYRTLVWAYPVKSGGGGR